MTEAMTKKQFNSALTSIRKRADALAEDIQYKAIAYIDQQALHENFDPISQLLNTLNSCKMDGMRTQIRKYLVEYFPVKVTFSKTGGFQTAKNSERCPDKMPSTFLPYYVGANGEQHIYTFWQFNREDNDKEQADMNVDKAVKRFDTLVKKIEKELSPQQAAAFWAHVAEAAPDTTPVKQEAVKQEPIKPMKPAKIEANGSAAATAH